MMMMVDIYHFLLQLVRLYKQVDQESDVEKDDIYGNVLDYNERRMIKYHRFFENNAFFQKMRKRQEVFHPYLYDNRVELGKVNRLDSIARQASHSDECYFCTH
jgi:hypothetical protein